MIPHTTVDWLPGIAGQPGRKVITTTVAPWARLTTSIIEDKVRGETFLWIDRHGGGTVERKARGWLSASENQLLAWEIVSAMERTGHAGSQSDWLRLSEPDLHDLENAALGAA